MNQPDNAPGILPPVYQTHYYMPVYRAGDYGDWRVSIMGMGHDYGYVSGVQLIQNVPILTRRDNDQWLTWMSLTPHEVESQELGAKYGYGHVVIMGLGLGWVAANAALNPKVTKVTVVELDPLVIEMINTSGSLDGLPEEIRNKITIVNEDALKWKCDTKVDFLYVDIWRTLNEESVIGDVRAMQNNLHADVIYYWGQEITIYNEIMNSDSNIDITYESIDSVINSNFKFPLLIPKDFDYPGMIRTVIENRKKRGMKV